MINWILQSPHKLGHNRDELLFFEYGKSRTYSYQCADLGGISFRNIAEYTNWITCIAGAQF
jgi:hypothetical protein